MADNDNTTGNSGEIELEAKRRADSSWHPCQVSLRYGGGLSVKLEDQDLEDVILNVQDAFAYLRVRSAPLCGDNCCYITEGTHVLVAYEQNSQRFFFDAVVEKAVRVRHSKRACCRCTFMIKWLLQNLGNESLTLPSESIMKLATESIKSHPVVAAFLDSAGTSSWFTPLPSPSVFYETEGEIDLHGLLERQIEEIGSLADVSKKELLKDSLMGDNHGIEGWPKLLASEQASKLQVEVSCRPTHLRRSRRKEDKLQTTTEDLKSFAPSSVEKSEEYKSHLSPLGARAVLASLVSKVPQKFEFVHDDKGKHVSILDYTAHNHCSLTVKNGMTAGGSDTRTINNVEITPAELADNVESLTITKTGASCKKFCTRKSHGALVSGDSDKNEIANGSGGSLSPPSSIRGEETIQPVRAGRLTRSVTKRDSGTPNGRVISKMLAEDVTVAQATSLEAHKGNGNLADQIKETLLNKPARVIVAALMATKREPATSNTEYKRKTLDGKDKVTVLTNRTCITRSASRKEIGTSDGKVEGALQGRPGTESTQSDDCQESDSMSESEESTNKRALPLDNAQLKLAESNKKQKGSYDVERRQKAAVEGLHSNVENHSQKKSISSRNQPLRFSPRLRSLPQT